MKIQAVSESLLKSKAVALVVGSFEDRLGKDAEMLDKVLGGQIKDLWNSKEFSGKFREIQTVSTAGRIAAKRVVLVGLGKENEFDEEKARKASGFAAKYIRSLGIRDFSTALHNIRFSQQHVQAVVEGTILGLYRFTRFKKADDRQIDSVSLLTESTRIGEVNKGIKAGQIVSDAANYVRDIVNLPANALTPSKLAGEADKLAKENRLKIKVYGRTEIEKLGMGCLLAVSKGSSEEPKFIVLEHNPGAKEKIAVVGKGITFDSGGLDIKPFQYMEDMKNDKAGAAAVLGVMAAASKLNVPLHVIGLIPATENMPSGSATKPGDIVAAYSKKTVEIINTDAEGRLVLCDALSFAEEKFRPDAIIDLATLTGACVVALGYEAAAVLGTDQRLVEKIKSAGEKCRERVWPLPLWEDYDQSLESDAADIMNTTKGMDRAAGTIQGAAFLKKFVSVPWAHIDIAGTAWLPAERDYQPKGATGYGVRLITQMLLDWKK